jgi:hypothetical protein
MLYQTISLIVIAILASVYVMICTKCGKEYIKHEHHYKNHVKQCNSKAPFGAGVSGCVAAHHLFLRHVHIGSHGIGISPQVHLELAEQMTKMAGYANLPITIPDHDEFCPGCGLENSFEVRANVKFVDDEKIIEQYVTCIDTECKHHIRPQTMRVGRLGESYLVPKSHTNDDGELVKDEPEWMLAIDLFENADLRRQPTPKEVAKTVRDTDTITAAHEGITLPTEVPETKPRRRLPMPAARRGGPQKPAPEATSEEPQESDDLATLLATFEKQNSF